MLHQKHLTNKCSIVYNKITSYEVYNWIWCLRRGIVRHQSAIPAVFSFRSVPWLATAFFVLFKVELSRRKQYGLLNDSKLSHMSIWFEAIAKLSPIISVDMWRLFVFLLALKSNLRSRYITSVVLWKLNDRPNGIWLCDDLPVGSERGNAVVRFRGRNDIREKRQKGSWAVKVGIYPIEKTSTMYASFEAFLSGKLHFLQVLNCENSVKNVSLAKAKKKTSHF